MHLTWSELSACTNPLSCWPLRATPTRFIINRSSFWSLRSRARVTSISTAISCVVMGSLACRRMLRTRRLISPRCAQSEGGRKDLGLMASSSTEGSNCSRVASRASRSATSFRSRA